MSANNEIIIVRTRKRRYEIYLNSCVDNEFDYRKNNPISIENSKKKAFSKANDFDTEYGTSYIDVWSKYFGVGKWKKKN